MFVKNLWVVDHGVKLGGLRGRVGNVCEVFMGGRLWS